VARVIITVTLLVYTVIAPNLIVALIVDTVITPTSVDTPTAGQAYSLNCSLTGIIDTMVTYQWFKGSASNGTQLTNTNQQLQFSSLRASDAGLYTCRATVNSVQIEETATVTISRKYINITSSYIDYA
jgi:hypothetical protein